MSRRERQKQDALDDEPCSDNGSDSGLDIIKSTRKSLDLSQYIDALAQSQTQSHEAEAEAETADEGTDGDIHEEQTLQLKQPPRSRGHHYRNPETEQPAEDVDERDGDDWSADDDGLDAWRAFKERKTLKRKRAAAETNRLRGQRKSQAAAATSIVGRKLPPKKKGKELLGTLLSTASDAEAEGPYLEEPTPEYIEARKRTLKKLQNAGLRYPPSYDDVDFSDSELMQKPILHRDVKRQRAKKDIELDESGGVIPASIAQWLREYQVEGVQFLHERFVKQTGALLGDDMGLGKTIQVIAFLTAAFGKTGSKRDSKCMRKVRRMGDDRWYPRILIICPGGLMSNWEDELEKWGWWQAYRYHGNPADRKGVLNAARKGMLEIMITTYTTYRNNEGEINTIDWDCIIADECHQIKSKESEITKAMNKINALCRIGLTGTAIQNKYEELWNLLNWARPGAYGSAQEWNQKISLPLKMGQAHDATHGQIADGRRIADQLVKDILPSVFLRRMKTLIADQLPKKSDRVVFCNLTETQAEAYRTFLDSDKCEAIRRAKEQCECGSGKSRGHCCHQNVPGEEEKWAKFMFPCIATLSKLANHVGLILPRTADTKEKQDKDVDTLTLAFPDEWQDLLRIQDSILKQSQREFCGKWKVLRRLLDFWHSEGDKVLIFSHSVRLLQLLKGLFTTDGTKYNISYLDGSMSYEDRAKAVADFNSDPNQFIFLISTKAGGVGLNITSANKVVVVDPNWNPAYDLQAQDRAYRIGQTRDVEVFRLISVGTIEEIVYARQIYKQQQANTAYTAEATRRYFTGVQGVSEKTGELFGLENLFSFHENGFPLRNIIHNTNVAETRAGVKAMGCSFEDTQPDSDNDDDPLSDKSLGLKDDDISMNSQIDSFLHEVGISETATSGRKHGTTKKPALAKRTEPDAVNAILAKAGVQYTHENSEVIAHSEIEARLGKQAIELRNDVEFSRKRVFQASQSQSQSQSQVPLDDFPHLELGPDEGADSGAVAASRRAEFKIHYKYRPSEDVRRRLFCEMSRVWGYDDVAEFALVVESATQEERRKMLDRFYRARRREMEDEFGGR